MTDHTPLTYQQLNEIDAHVNGPLGAATVFDQQTVTRLVAEVRRLQQQRKYLIGQLAKRDAERALREFLTAHPGEVEMAASMVRDGFGPGEVVEILRRPVAPAAETGE